MTAGDWIWAALDLRHRAVYGLMHGTVLCAWIGVGLGLMGRRVGAGALLGAIVGLAAAASFYALAPFMGYSAMFVSWVGLWLGLAWVAGRLLGTPLAVRSGFARAAVAAAGSGLTFYAISGIWMNPSPTPNYFWHLLAWLVAFLPGCVALLVGFRIRT